MKRLIKFVCLINGMFALSACHSMSGNVVPQNAPTMERVYDSMRYESIPEKSSIAHRISSGEKVEKGTTHAVNGFHKLKNPALKVMVLPHLSGDEEVPIPLYTTYISAYDKDYYALPYEN